MNPVPEPVFESGYRHSRVFHHQEPNRAKIYLSKLTPKEQMGKINGVWKILRTVPRKPKTVTGTAYLGSTGKV